MKHACTTVEFHMFRFDRQKIYDAMESPSSDAHAAIRQHEPFQFFQSVMAIVVGNLVAWSLALLLYLLYRLWQVRQKGFGCLCHPFSI